MGTNEKYSYGYARKLNNYFKKHEKKYDLRLKANRYYVIRFDGKEMTKAFKKKKCAIYEKFFHVMKETFKQFCDFYKNVIFGYSFSDEISILIRVDKRIKNEEQKDNNRIEKLLSLMPCKLSLLFNRIAVANNLDLQNKDWLFDARIIEFEKREEVSQYFIARQAYAIDKYLTQLKGEHNIDYKLHKSDDIITELDKIGIKYSDLPINYRYGLMYVKVKNKDVFEFSNNITMLEKLCFIV